MQLTFNRSTYPWLQPKYFDMHLLDNSCRPYHVNFTHIVVKTTYGNCKTVAKNSSHDVTYRNIFMAMVRTSSAKVITRVPNVWFPFQCRFDHTKMESIPFKLYGKPTSLCSGGGQGTADREKGGPKVYGTGEKKGQEAGFPRWREAGEREKNYATLRNISRSKKCKEAGANKYRAETGLKGT